MRRVPNSSTPSYSISQGGLENMPRGIRVRAIGSGSGVHAGQSRGIDNPKARAEVESHIPTPATTTIGSGACSVWRGPGPMGRAACPEEIVPVFAFLASDDASYITGQTLYACGGLNAVSGVPRGVVVRE